MEATAVARPGVRLEGSLAWLLPLAAVVAACVVYLLLDLHPVDVAASTYRAWLFADHGFTLWNGNWYGGHYTLAYSVLAPLLAWLVGPVALSIGSAVAATGLFHLIAQRHFGSAGLAGATWFGLAAATLVFHGRVTFAAGVVLGLAAVLSLQRGRPVVALGAAILCGLTSPVAGVFLALAGVAAALAGRRRIGWGIAAAAVVPVLAIEVLFPEGGQQPYSARDLVWLLVSAAIVLILLPRRERAIRVGAWLYAAGGVAVYVLDTPLGNNVCRLAPLFAGPLVLSALASSRHTRARRPLVLGAALLLVLLYFQWKPVYDDIGKVRADPVVEPSYYRPLLGFLDRAGGPPFRVEIPFTQAHWEAAEVARRFPLARGWERQLDGTRDALFYGGVLNRVTYGTWLAEHGVRFVAVASGKPDFSSYKERALIETGLPYLKPVWRSHDWRVYEVTLPHAILVPRAPAAMKLVSLGNSQFVIDVRRPGEAAVKVHWSPYWRAYGGCVQRDGQWTQVTAQRQGLLRVGIDFSPERILSHGRRCG